MPGRRPQRATGVATSGGTGVTGGPGESRGESSGLDEGSIARYRLRPAQY
ncbi:MAG: hypothetical protein OXL38_02030 [Gammaproteobacteria bacterium]|nr:hypothetical protein [Gammaproteobacteria bacterium]